MLPRRQVLVPEDEDMMIQMRLVNARKVRFVDWAGRVEAEHLGAQGIRKRTDHEGHRFFSSLFELHIELAEQLAYHLVVSLQALSELFRRPVRRVERLR